MSNRLDAIIAMHTGKYDHNTDDKDQAPFYWGFYPRNMEKKTIQQIKKDVKKRPDYYNNPLYDFHSKLENAAKRWLQYYDVDWNEKAKSHFNSIWESVYDSEGNLRFTCETLETTDPRLLAWKLEWNGPGQAPLTNTENLGMIKALPAVVVLFLDDVLHLNDEGMTPLDGTYEHLENAQELTKSTRDELIEPHPYVVIAVNSHNMYAGVNSTQVPVSMVLDTMSIALELDVYNLPFIVNRLE